MVQILDEHLKKLQCSECKKYLSVFPVKVYKFGVIKCGRCTKTNDGGVASLYEVIAQHCLFKCVNRYEGCRKLLLASEVVAHEETCTGRRYNCPSCINSQMLSYEFLQHFKIRHSKNFLRSNVCFLSFSKNIYIKETFCYIQDDNIFIILLQYVPYDRCLYICTVTLTDLENVKQHYILFTETFPFRQITATKKCVSLEKFNSDSYYKININDIFTRAIKFKIILDTSETTIRSYEVECFRIFTALQTSLQKVSCLLRL